MLEGLLSSVLTVSTLGITAWLSRTWITARLTASLRVETESKLEELKAQLQRANTTLADIGSAGRGALSATHTVAAQKKVEAIDQIWSAVLDWGQYTALMMIVPMFTKEWVAKHGKDPTTKSNFEIFLSPPNHIEFMKRMNAVERWRPFVSQELWALFAAYNTLHGFRMTKATLLTISSIDHEKLWDSFSERTLIKNAASLEILNQYDSNITTGTMAFITYIKNTMLEEIRAELEGGRAAMKAVVNASAILSAVEELKAKSESQNIAEAGAKLGVEE